MSTLSATAVLHAEPDILRSGSGRRQQTRKAHTRQAFVALLRHCQGARVCEHLRLSVRPSRPVAALQPFQEAFAPVDVCHDRVVLQPGAAQFTLEAEQFGP